MDYKTMASAYRQYAQTRSASNASTSSSSSGLGSRSTNAPKQQEEKKPSIMERFIGAFSSSGGSIKLDQKRPDPLRVYDMPNMQDIQDYNTRTNITDSLYDAQGMINQAYTPQMLSETRPMTAEEIKKFAPVKELTEKGITVEQLSAMDAPMQKATLESLGITNAQWVSSQGPRPMSLQEFDRQVMESVHSGYNPNPNLYQTAFQQPTLQGLGYNRADITPAQPSAEQTTILPNSQAMMTAPTLGEEPNLDTLSNQMLEKPVAATPSNGLMSQPSFTESQPQDSMLGGLFDFIPDAYQVSNWLTGGNQLDGTQSEEVATSGEGLMSRRLDEKGTGGTEYLTTVKPSADSMATSIASEIVMSSPDLASIISLEGFDKKPVELNSTRNLSPTQHRSGLTVGSGIDVGQYNKAGLKKAGFSDKVIKKFGDWIGLNPDTIIDPATGVNPVQQIPRDRRFQTVTVNGQRKRVPTAEYTAARARGHQLMAQKYSQMDEAGTLPEFTLGELEDMAKSTWKSSGLDRAKGEYGEGWDNLPEDVKFVLAQNAYVQGQNRSDAMIERARQGQSAYQVLDAMTGPSYLETRKANVATWLRNNSFEDDPKMSKQGLQIMTNSLIDELGLDTRKLDVDAKIGPSTRRTVDSVLRSQGVTVPSNVTDSQRMKLIQELTYETLLPPTGN